MDVNIVKIGNSQGVRLPKALLQDLKLQNGRTLHAHVEGNSLVLSPKKSRQAQSFTNVLANIISGGGINLVLDASEWQRQQRQADWKRDPRENQ